MINCSFLSNSEMLCYKVKRYSYKSLGVDTCPATCKLKDAEKEEHDCEEYGEDSIVVAKEGTLIVLQSPNYVCNGSQYHRNEICVYNVSMSCNTDHVVVSRQPYHTHLAIHKNDFVQVVDYTYGQVYEKVSGWEWPKSQAAIYSTDFVLVFWSDLRWKPPVYRGFKLHMECGSNTNSSNNVPQSEGSADEGSADEGSADEPTQV